MGKTVFVKQPICKQKYVVFSYVSNITNIAIVLSQTSVPATFFNLFT